MPESFIFILILLAGFYMAWSIGANDVANAMGTSVGSGALSLKQAILIAAILEFCGAFFFGSYVSETIQNGIIDASFFKDAPLHLVYGMLAALISVGMWLQIATYFGWPVSTTHSIVGALVGFGLVVGGFNAIQWKEVLYIFSSWILSPIIGGVLGYAIFSLIRNQIFYHPHPLESAKTWMPIFTFCVMCTLCLITLYKGLYHVKVNTTIWEPLLLSLFFGLSAALISYLWVKKIQITPLKNDQFSQLHTIERMFGVLQILSACLMAFAHGANDVANAIGPLSSAISILKTGVIETHAVIPTWTLALGGIGIVVGLATWGWRVILTIGKRITELTPTRGFSAEFGAAFTILTCSSLGLPISTTHTLVGAVIGVGMARGLEALNLKTMRDIMISWLVTVPAGGIMAVGIYLLLVSIL